MANININRSIADSFYRYKMPRLITKIHSAKSSFFCRVWIKEFLFKIVSFLFKIAFKTLSLILYSNIVCLYNGVLSRNINLIELLKIS